MIETRISSIAQIEELKFIGLYSKPVEKIIEKDNENKLQTIDGVYIKELIYESSIMVDGIGILRVLSENNEYFYVYLLNRIAITNKNNNVFPKNICDLNNKNLLYKFYIKNNGKNELLKSTNNLNIEFEGNTYKPATTKESGDCYFNIKTLEILYKNGKIIHFLKKKKNGEFKIEAY